MNSAEALIIQVVFQPLQGKDIDNPAEKVYNSLVNQYLPP
jgi:hypothetical protein